MFAEMKMETVGRAERGSGDRQEFIFEKKGFFIFSQHGPYIQFHQAIVGKFSKIIGPKCRPLI
jgi:hypothetical protein